MGCGLREDEEQEGTHVSLPILCLMPYIFNWCPPLGVVQWWSVVGILQGSCLLQGTEARR